MKLIFELTEDEVDILSETLWDHQDCGPYGEGWKSEELDALVDKLTDSIEKQREAQR